MQTEILQRLALNLVAIIISTTIATAQNVGIGVSNPQKGKLEIAGALGGHTTVLTIGSDGTGISLQRNWPTIGFNQYRDASNTQRFIGAGFAASIFVSAVDGSIVFSQFGQGTANQEITNASYPLVIDPFGTTTINGGLWLKNGVSIDADKSVLFTGTPKIVSIETGILRNLLPFCYGYIKSDGTRFRGTENFTSSWNAGLSGYIISFTDQNATPILTATAVGHTYSTTSYALLSAGLVIVYIWNKDGQKIQGEFSFTMYKD